MQIVLGRHVGIEHRDDAPAARPAQGIDGTGGPARIGHHDVGAVQHAQVQPVGTINRIAAVVEDLPFAAGIDHDGRHRGQRAGHTFEAAVLHPFDAQAVAQQVHRHLVADPADHAHRRAQSRRGNRCIERHAAGAGAVAPRGRLGRAGGKRVDLEHMVERRMPNARDTNRSHERSIAAPLTLPGWRVEREAVLRESTNGHRFDNAAAAPAHCGSAAATEPSARA